MTDYDPLTIQDFKGQCFGVRLKTRAQNDPEIMFQVLVNDDDHWFVSHTSSGACFWMKDFMTQMNHAFEFIHENPAVEKHQWGFRWMA